MNTAEALADPATRVAVVAELSRGASLANRSGNRAMNDGRYQFAVAEFKASAQRLRAAEALSKGPGFDPRDLCHVEEALTTVRVRMTSGAAVKGGAQ